MACGRCRCRLALDGDAAGVRHAGPDPDVTVGVLALAMSRSPRWMHVADARSGRRRDGPRPFRGGQVKVRGRQQRGSADVDLPAARRRRAPASDAELLEARFDFLLGA